MVVWETPRGRENIPAEMGGESCSVSEHVEECSVYELEHTSRRGIEQIKIDWGF